MECSRQTDTNLLTHQLQSCRQGIKRTVGQYLDFVGTGIRVFKLFCWTAELRSSRQCLLPWWLLFPRPFATPSLLLSAELLPRGLQQCTGTVLGPDVDMEVYILVNFAESALLPLFLASAEDIFSFINQIALSLLQYLTVMFFFSLRTRTS